MSVHLLVVGLLVIGCFVIASTLVMLFLNLVGYLLVRVVFRRSPNVVSQAWCLDQQRRDMASGIDLPCIHWGAMKALARERGVI